MPVQIALAAQVLRQHELSQWQYSNKNVVLSPQISEAPSDVNLEERDFTTPVMKQKKDLSDYKQMCSNENLTTINHIVDIPLNWKKNTTSQHFTKPIHKRVKPGFSFL